MIIDAQHLLSDAQALIASGASTNVIDFRSDRNIGIGEPLAVVITVDVALAGTFQARIETDDNQGFSSPADVITGKQYTSLPAGSKIVIPLPADTIMERYLRVYYTLGGTNPSITVTAVLQPASMVPAEAYYPDGITIQ